MNKLWLKQLKDNINNNIDLIKITKIKKKNSKQFLCKKKNISFKIKIPKIFIKKIEKKNYKDPILLQFIFNKNELIFNKKYNSNPLNENLIIPGMIHKYYNRVLILVTGICAVHCRYCFRKKSKEIYAIKKCDWIKIINYIKKHREINEVIFSGGDPLIINDHKINLLINDIQKISHIKTLRIHTRIISVIPERITTNLIKIFNKYKLNIIIVTHINHPNEISENLFNKVNLLKKTGVTILNQSVLLKNINDDYKTLIKLSNNLFNIGILPYYLHLLDKVEGSQHFNVSESKAKKIMIKMLPFLSGFLVPRLIKDIYGKKSKNFII
ncbi:KamA family radical SAM protein [Enterobacteriaceae endosymbiont of Donacia dentata]|uniref:KamA family radical SAM protein n=1 Tax=Enterobacteriaceae endosymbiont of Donacia dentata TaxID=2675777 RepID=UPI0014494BA6|nr:KamA family radical SAM protein [Enterobacteriaceae endosymbiont of Donacia dentata]QJC32447.1 KamA family radical SAM protein [Enterobacteriaceae endosymbiont of Donacia dentata]